MGSVVDFDKPKYWAQGNNSCCFVYAVANVCVAFGGVTTESMISKACKLGLCENGATIKRKEVIDYFGLVMEKTDDPEKVLTHGGVLSIYHPIYNGHAVCIVPWKGRDSILAINSWLGPLEAHLGKEEMRPYITDKMISGHWVFKGWVGELVEPSVEIVEIDRGDSFEMDELSRGLFTREEDDE